MTVLLALVAAFGYGMSDFLGALASRRLHVAVVTLIVQAAAGLISWTIAIGASASFDVEVVAWGSLAGLGSAVGTLALYRGLSVGRMTVVAPVSAVVAAALPSIVGIVSGDRLSTLGWAGVVLALPATVLLTRVPVHHTGPTGVREALVAGMGFALLFIGLHRAGDDAGTWPLVWEMGVSTLVLLPFAWRGWRRTRPGASASTSVGLAVLAAVLGVLGGECFILASAGSLTIASIVTSMYPAVTVALAYLVLRERISSVQGLGLALAAASVALIGA